MRTLAVKQSAYDFSALGPAMQAYVDGDILAGISWALLEGDDILDLQCLGWADREARTALRQDHIFRAFSNSKLLTSLAVLLLKEDHRLDIDDPIEKYLPQLGARRVLKQGATALDQTEPARGPIRIRHLLSHTSGLSYGLFDPGSVLFKAYSERKVLNPATPLSDIIDQLADLPLAFEPGAAWEYSVATDVLGRLVEVVSGQRFDDFLKARIFDPVGMVDTGFFIPPAEQGRLVALYRGADLMNPMTPGLTRQDHAPYPGAYLAPAPRLSGGGGLVSTLPDMIALMRALMPGKDALLKPETSALMATNQLKPGQWINFALLGPMPGKGYCLAGSIAAGAAPFDPLAPEGEMAWGGVAGTHWWIDPKSRRAGVIMAQRHMAFWNPFYFDFKTRAARAFGAP